METPRPPHLHTKKFLQLRAGDRMAQLHSAEKGMSAARRCVFLSSSRDR